MRIFRWKFLSQVLLALFLVLQFVYFNHRFIALRKNTKSRVKKHRNSLRNTQFVLHKVMNKKFELPKELKNVPFAGNSLVLQVKEVPIRNVFAPYNASIIENDKGGYTLLFRYDQVRNMYVNNSIYTHIGCAQLDKDFKQTKAEFFPLETGTNTSEDPRIFRKDGRLMVLYNDLFNPGEPRRGMHLAEINTKQKIVSNIQPLDLGLSPVEKNWAPFLLEDDELCFEYQVSEPRKILRISDPTPSMLSPLSDLESWETKFGKPLGGTPARLVDGQYLSFFHSKFRDKSGIFWYVFGAYTFETTPPFQITSCSAQPILFEGIYASEYLNTAEPSKCVIFPGSFALDRSFIHLACGENDSCIKVVTFDKKELLKTLVPVQAD